MSANKIVPNRNFSARKVRRRELREKQTKTKNQKPRARVLLVLHLERPNSQHHPTPKHTRFHLFSKEKM